MPLPKQIRRSVLGEAFVVGVLASVGGIAGGIAVAKGIDCPLRCDRSAPHRLAADPRAPNADRRRRDRYRRHDGRRDRAGSSSIDGAAHRAPQWMWRCGRRRLAHAARSSGVGLFAAGLASGAVGLAGVGSTAVTVATLAFGVVAIFLGVTLLSPLVVGVVTRLFGWPMRKVTGVAGRLAQKNAARNPRRTATTAAALMIGLALVTTALVVGQSVKSTIGADVREVVEGRLLRQRRSRRGRLPSHARVRHEEVRRGRRSDRVHEVRRHASTAP